MDLKSFNKVVPTAKDFIEIIFYLKKTKTPPPTTETTMDLTRKYFMRKLKYKSFSCDNKLTEIINDFSLDNIHPFYKDLINILCNKDEYKLVLDQLKLTITLINKITNDRLKLLKYGDTLYRCKNIYSLGKANIKSLFLKIESSLIYLEDIRKHLLPIINLNKSTLLLSGYPNVGKSTFINKLTSANVEMVPFITKSLFFGTTTTNNQWQIIDIPGVFDHPLDDSKNSSSSNNSIEIQSSIALGHLNACVLFFIDISETCGWPIKQQVDLFFNIKTLFLNKAWVVVLSKIDLRKQEDIPKEDWELIQSMIDIERGIHLVSMSNLTEEGVSNVLYTASLALKAQKKIVKSNIGSDIDTQEFSNKKPLMVDQYEQVNQCIIQLNKISIEKNDDECVFEITSSEPTTSNQNNSERFLGQDIINRLEEIEIEELSKLRQKESNKNNVKNLE